MNELRRARFASIDGLQRQDLRLAGEVWLDEVCRAPWVTRDAMKLAAHLVRYITDADPQLLTLGSIEGQAQLGPDEVKTALRLLHLYMAVEAYTVEKNEVRVALNLSELQRVRVLEARRRLEMLHARVNRSVGSATPSDHWVPEETGAQPATAQANSETEVTAQTVEGLPGKACRDSRLYLRRPNQQVTPPSTAKATPVT